MTQPTDFTDLKNETAPRPPARHRLRMGLLIAGGVLLTLVAVGALMLNHFFGQMQVDPYEKSVTYGGEDMLTGDVPPIEEAEVPEPSQPASPVNDDEKKPSPTDGQTMQTLLRQWCKNGEPVSSSRVLNILLIGTDNEDVAVDGRADSLILCSVNTEAHTFTMASLLRDQYACIRTDGGTGETFEKLHLANVYGGPEQMIATIESHYKVQIDNYLLTSRAAFPKIIDRLGGVTITLTEEEAAALGGDVSPGEQTANGDLALRYSRLRELDSEQNRTGRQRQLLEAVTNQLSGASVGELIALVGDVMPYIRTGMTRAQLVGYAGQAVSEGWFSYARRQLYTPAGKCWRGATVDGLWYWLVDYPAAAHDLQIALYGKSNITLREDRTSFLAYPLR